MKIGINKLKGKYDLCSTESKTEFDNMFSEAKTEFINTYINPIVREKLNLLKPFYNISIINVNKLSIIEDLDFQERMVDDYDKEYTLSATDTFFMDYNNMDWINTFKGLENTM